jgi:hypothetical protein
MKLTRSISLVLLCIALVPSLAVGQELKPGDLIWEFRTGSYVASSPAIGADGTVYVGSDESGVYALDGNRARRGFQKPRGWFHSSPAVGADGTVYVGSREHKVYAFETSSTGPADSPWPLFGQNAQRTGITPSPVADKIEIYTFSKSASPFTISFESRSGATYIIEVTHDLKQWGELGEVQATGSSVEFTDWRKALFQKQYYRVKLVE